MTPIATKPITITSQSITIANTEEANSSLNKNLLRTTRIIVYCFLLLLPFFFGGVHNNSRYFFQTIIFCFSSIFISYLFVTNKKCPHVFYLPLYFLLIILIPILFYYTGAYSPVDHPLFGNSLSHPFPYYFWHSIRSILAFSCIYFLTSVLLTFDIKESHRLENYLIGLSFLISLTALSHWFYDNGKLFWFIAPDNIFTSPRARWPFVNSNHLGCFLIPLLFISVGRLKNESIELLEQISLTTKNNSLSYILSNKRLQNTFILILFFILITIAQIISIAATLSRGSWIGLAIGIMLYLFLTWKIDSPTNLLYSNIKPKSRKKISKSLFKHKYVPLFVKLSILVVMFGLILFFLRGSGVELIEGRIEYGLINSKSDIRWQLYLDTLELLPQYLFYGIGLGAWQFVYPQVMNPLITGINPVYLHSDPFQFFIETGIFPSILILGLFLFYSLKTYKAIRSSKSVHLATNLISLYCGIVAMLTASFFDFPFRFPAVQLFLAVYISLLNYYLFNSRLKDTAKLPPQAKEN